MLKESGIGIPDLVVVIYDLDPGTRPEEDFSPSNPSTNPSQPTPPLLGYRLGSVRLSAE